MSKNRRKISNTVRRGVLAKHGSACVYCGTESADLTMDHVVPLCAGGTNDADNLVPACEDCNVAMGSKGHVKHERVGAHPSFDNVMNAWLNGSDLYKQPL